MLIQLIMTEGKKECKKDSKEDGMEPIQFTLDNLPNKNKNTETILKLISKTTEKIKESKR